MRSGRFAVALFQVVDESGVSSGVEGVKMSAIILWLFAFGRARQVFDMIRCAAPASLSRISRLAPAHIRIIGDACPAR